jgi:hypothetical protein
MSSGAGNPMSEPFLLAATTVAQDRPEVDLEIARELMQEAATVLHNGLALDGLDAHDTGAVVAALSLDLVARDPGTAVGARAEATAQDPGALHDPDAVSATYLVVAAMLQL